MRRLGTLVMAILLIAGCNAMQPNMEETELLWAEMEKNMQKWAITTKAETGPAEKPRSTPEQTVEIPQRMPKLAEEPAPETPAATPTPEPLLPEQEIAIQPAQAIPQQAEQPKESPAMIAWPYPAITCPPKPEPTPETNWPYIVVPEPPTYTPEPDPTEPLQDKPMTTPQPIPAAPAPEPTEQPAETTPELPTEQPSSGYAQCSCGARLTPEELIPHMKAHAMKVESHSYRAY